MGGCVVYGHLVSLSCGPSASCTSLVTGLDAFVVSSQDIFCLGGIVDNDHALWSERDTADIMMEGVTAVAHCAMVSVLNEGANFLPRNAFRRGSRHRGAVARREVVVRRLDVLPGRVHCLC